MVTTKGILNHINGDFFNTNKERVKHLSRYLSGSKRSESPRVYLKIQTNKRDLFVKYSPREDEHIFKHEYDALREVRRIPGFGVPQPIKLLKNGILLSKTNGRPLELLLKSYGFNAKNLKILETVLNCIILFHLSITQPTQRSPISQIYKEITGKKKLAANIELVISKAHLGFTHGDLDPFNILAENIDNKFRFNLIDWEDFRAVGIQELDVIHFIAMTGLIINSGHGFANNKELYHIIFDNYKGNHYLGLLSLYCKKRQTAIDDVLRLIPVYCDAQNYRLIKAGRDTSKFLYSDFKKEYYETK